MDAVSSATMMPILLDNPQALGRTNGSETAARGFEEMFASMMIKQMRQSLHADTLFGRDSGDVLGGMFDHFMGQHLAQSGSLGIGTMVRRYLQTRAQNDRNDSHRAGNQHGS